MKIGDYVRTENGEIGTIIDCPEQLKKDYGKWLWFETAEEQRPIRREQIDKSSSNIIDLIEVGDYVNGYPVAKIYKSTNKNIGRIIEYETDNVGGYEYEAEDLWESHIKSISIVTKEQFKSMEYKYDR